MQLLLPLLLPLSLLVDFSLGQVTFQPWGNWGQQPVAPNGQFGQQFVQQTTFPPFGQFGGQQGVNLPPFGQPPFGGTLPPIGQGGNLPFGQGGIGGGGMPPATTPTPPVGQPLLINSGAGQIQGLTVTETKTNSRYGVFLGIPYAQPPIGNLRFQNPLPLPPSSQVIQAVKYGKNCASVPYDANTQSEDCLFLNIFTPKNSAQAGGTQLYPVLLWIHGGALQMGSGDYSSINNLLSSIVSKGVVMVSINYRLGPWGFWTSRSQVAPGNMGFLDQSMAIKWVSNNIAAFGGDPQQITLVGQSAGGQSVSAQTLSPMSNTLFKRGIIMSSPLFAVGEIFLDSWPTNPSMELAQSVGCWNAAGGNDSAWRNALNCIKNVPVQKISDFEKTKPSMPYQRYGLRPMDGTFFPRPLDELARSRPPKDIMIGTTKEEYISLAQLEAMMGGQAVVKTAEDIISASIPSFVTSQVFTSAPVVQKAAQYQYVDLVRRSATKPPVDPNFWFRQDVKMKSAIQFWNSAFIDARYLQQSGSNVYLYSWEYLSDKPGMPGQINGVGHGSELDIIFDQPGRGPPGPPTADSYRDSAMKQLSSNIWTNFVKTGRPGVTWTPLNLNDWNYLSIDYPTPQMKSDYHWEDSIFWTGLVPSLQSAATCNSGGFQQPFQPQPQPYQPYQPYPTSNPFLPQQPYQPIYPQPQQPYPTYQPNFQGKKK